MLLTKQDMSIFVNKCKNMPKYTSGHNSQGGRWNEPKFGTTKFLNTVNICAKNRKGQEFFFVELIWNDPVYQISEQSNDVFVFYDNFFCLMKRRKTKQTKKKKPQEKKWRNSANIQGFTSRKHLARFSLNLECEVMTLAGISTANISWFCWSVT